MDCQRGIGRGSGGAWFPTTSPHQMPKALPCLLSLSRPYLSLPVCLSSAASPTSLSSHHLLSVAPHPSDAAQSGVTAGWQELIPGVTACDPPAEGSSLGHGPPGSPGWTHGPSQAQTHEGCTMHRHTCAHAHTHNPKTPAANKDAHRNLLLQLT